MTRPAGRFPLLLVLGTLLACGGGGGSTPTPVPSPTPAGNPVVAVLFYDEDGDGRLDAGEGIRVPDVEVNVGGRSAKSEKLTGRAVVTGVPSGPQAVTVRADTLPPFYAAGAPVPVAVPQADGGPVLIPLTLPVGYNPNVYMAFGDSITRGDGSASGGYPPMLQALLTAHFGWAQVNNRGADATNSYEGVERIKRMLRGNLPAYTLILYGTNDWHAPECQDTPDSANCHTVDNLRTIVEATKDFRSLPFLATLLPVDPTVFPAGRNQWVDTMNERIKTMARGEGAFLVDLNKAYKDQGDITKLFSEGGVHPNDDGYRVVARAFFEAIAHGRPAGAASTPSLFALPRH